jgi:hypothetical protein
MRVSGYLVPFPDPGAADLMSDHLEQEVHADGPGWILLCDTTSDSDQESEEVSWEVLSSGTLKCRLTNMSGTGGQFSLECTFVPRHES